MEYILTFFISVLFTYYADKCYNNKIVFCFFSLLALFFPIFLATCRDDIIGTDTKGYVETVWNLTVSCNSFSEFISCYKEGLFEDIEIVYLLINYLASFISKDVHTVYFFSSFIIMILIYKTAYDNRKNAPMWLTMLIFYLLYYNLSLNMIRQSIALAICMYSYKYLKQGRWIYLSIILFIALNSHHTALFFIPFVVLYIISQRKLLKKMKSFLKLAIFSLSFVFIYTDYLILLLVNWGILPPKFLYYLANKDDAFISKSTILVYLYINLILYVDYRFNQINKKTRYLCFSLKSIGSITFCLSLISQWAYRVSYYFNYIADCIFLPESLANIKKISKQKYNLYMAVLIILLLAYWYFTIVVANVNETYPYRSKILNI